MKIAVALVGVMLLTYGMPIQAFGDVIGRREPVERLDTYLSEIGTKLGCYFTIESDSHSSLITDPTGHQLTVNMQDVISNKLISVNYPPTIDLLIKKLRRELPKIDVVPDKIDPNILHLIAASLERDKNYVMERKMSLNTSLPLSELPYVLGRTLDGSINERSIFMTGDLAHDEVTKVKVSAKSLTVRQILTDYVPLSHYNHIIWDSVVEVKHPNTPVGVSVRYFGPIR